MLRLGSASIDQRAGRRKVWLAIGIWTVLMQSGCGIFGSGVDRYSISSREHSAELAPRLTVSGYTHRDENTADLYLTDIPLDELRRGVELDRLSGHIVHVHMFLMPRAGRTPIETTAFTSTVTHAVLARGEVGIYRGGGFMAVSGEPGDHRLGGTIQEGTLRLERASPGFLDRLGVSELDASFTVTLDQRLAALLRARLAQAIGRATHTAPHD